MSKPFLLSKRERDWRIPRLRKLMEMIGVCEFFDEIESLEDVKGSLIVQWSVEYSEEIEEDEFIITKAWQSLNESEVQFLYAPVDYCKALQKARLRVAELDRIDGFKDRNLGTIQLALVVGLRNPHKIAAAYEALAMLEDLTGVKEKIATEEGK